MLQYIKVKLKLKFPIFSILHEVKYFESFFV